jgi:hydrogenase maturation factor
VSSTDALSCTAPGLSQPGCITCGDIAVVLTVLDADGADARCRDETGREELVATELVGDVSPGDRVLVHAGVAIERVSTDVTAATGR